MYSWLHVPEMKIDGQDVVCDIELEQSSRNEKDVPLFFFFPIVRDAWK